MPGNQDACGIPGVGPIPGDPDLTVTLTATARDAGIDVRGRIQLYSRKTLLTSRCIKVQLVRLMQV